MDERIEQLLAEVTQSFEAGIGAEDGEEIVLLDVFAKMIEESECGCKGEGAPEVKLSLDLTRGVELEDVPTKLCIHQVLFIHNSLDEYLKHFHMIASKVALLTSLGIETRASNVKGKPWFSFYINGKKMEGLNLL